jgi:hypothetical protein
MTAKKPKAPKYPRVIVSQERHVALQAEADKKGITLTELAEQKFKRATR